MILTHAFDISGLQNVVGEEKTRVERFIKMDQIKELETALNQDGYFRGLTFEKILGSGSYGLALQMKDTVSDKMIAIKITNDIMIDKIPDDINEEHLLLNAGSLSHIYTNTRFLKYLEGNGVPFLPKTITDRNVVLFTKERNSNHSKLEIKNLWVQELGDLGNLRHYCYKNVSNDHTENRKFLLNIIYKILFSMNMIVENKVMHGDIKPDNIFIKTCILDGKLDICPIIGDWDLGYFYSDKPNRNLIPYTRGFKPVEMLYFASEMDYQISRSMFMADWAFTYSKKEDVFALGVTFLQTLCILTRCTPDTFKQNNHYDDILAIIAKMVHPVELEDIILLHSYGDHYKPSISYILEKSITAHLDRSHVNNLRNFAEIANKTYFLPKFIQKCGIKNLSYELRIKNYNPAVFFYRVYDCAMKDRSSKSIYQLFNDYAPDNTIIKDILDHKPLKKILDERLSIKDALERVKVLLPNDTYSMESMLEDEKLMKQNKVEPNGIDAPVGDRNILYLTESFMDKPAQEQVKLLDYISKDFGNECGQLHQNRYHLYEAMSNKGPIAEICAALLTKKKQSYNLMSGTFHNNRLYQISNSQLLLGRNPSILDAAGNLKIQLAEPVFNNRTFNRLDLQKPLNQQVDNHNQDGIDSIFHYKAEANFDQNGIDSIFQSKVGVNNNHVDLNPMLQMDKAVNQNHNNLNHNVLDSMFQVRGEANDNHKIDYQMQQGPNPLLNGMSDAEFLVSSPLRMRKEDKLFNKQSINGEHRLQNNYQANQLPNQNINNHHMDGAQFLHKPKDNTLDSKYDLKELFSKSIGANMLGGRKRSSKFLEKVQKDLDQQISQRSKYDLI